MTMKFYRGCINGFIVSLPFWIAVLIIGREAKEMGVFTVVGIMAVGFLSLVGLSVVIGGFAKYLIGEKGAK